MTTAPTLKALAAQVADADRLLQPHIVETPLRRAFALGRAGGSKVWLKCEHLQHTGSFKVRGATHKLLQLSSEERSAGVVAASSGNHGLGVAHAALRLNVRNTIFVPEGCSERKAFRIQESGGSIRTHGTDCAVTEAHAREYALEHGASYISPYNDLDVIAGQGVVGRELTRQTRPLDVVYVAVGGGGLLAGIGAALRAEWPDVDIVACSPSNSAVMLHSLEAGEILALPSEDTWSDGTAGGLEAGTITFGLCQQLVSRGIMVSEEAILDALVLLREDLGQLVEGAAGVAAAAYLADEERQPSDRVGLIVCGGNASAALEREMARRSPG